MDTVFRWVETDVNLWRSRISIIYSVTLRIWLPILNIIFNDFVMAYRILDWLCYVPNIVFAFFWIRKKGLI